MAEIEKDFVSDNNEWEQIIEKLEDKDKAIKTMLDEFIEALDILANNGFKEGNRKKNMQTLWNEVKTIRSQIDGIYSSTQTAISQLQTDIENADKY